jgi:hypothetical protein
MQVMQELLRPEKLFVRSDVGSRPCPVPQAPGVYAWYFSAVPPGIDASACHRVSGRTLLYVGISPKEPPSNGRAPSRQTLRSRLKYHFGGNAAGSTLRLTLGCLLSEERGLCLRRVGTSARLTFTNPGERQLDDWLDEYAFVTWVCTERPWEAEREILASELSLPLNLSGRRAWANAEAVSAARLTAKRRAETLPIILDSGGPRRLRV